MAGLFRRGNRISLYVIAVMILTGIMMQECPGEGTRKKVTSAKTCESKKSLIPS